MNARRKAAAVALSALTFGGIGLATAISASAASYDETYSCTYEAPKIAGSPNAWRICSGTWWHAEPNGRTLVIKAEIQYNPTTGERWEGVYYVADLDSVASKVIKWYCRLPGGGTSSQRGMTTLQPGTYYSWKPQFNACDPSYGYGHGMIAVVEGGCLSCSGNYTTNVYINDSWSGAGSHRGIQRTA
jgi:hypothetical protein